MRDRRGIALVVLLVAAAACADDVVSSPRERVTLRSELIEHEAQSLRDVLATDDGGAWLVFDGQARRIDAQGRTIVTADPSDSGDNGMGGFTAAVETPDGLFAVLPGCDCHDGRAIAGWLVRFDAEDGSLEAHRLLDRDSPYAIEHGAAGLWSVGTGVLRRIDPVTIEDQIVVAVDDATASLAVGDDAVYVGNAHAGVVERVDARTGSIRARFAGRGPIAGAQSVVSGDSVWTIENGGVVELDATSLEVIRRIPIDPMVSSDLALDGDVLWVYTEPGLFSIDLDRRGTAIERLTVTARHIGSIDIGGGALWLTDFPGRRLHRVELPPRHGR